jgi:hypothetical protein
MQSKDLEWVVGAIDINRETGGNLSEVLDSVSATIRERGRIARQVRTLTAEGRLSARILIALPLLMLVWQWRANPDNFELLTYGVGLVALVVAGILMSSVGLGEPDRQLGRPLIGGLEQHGTHTHLRIDGPGRRRRHALVGVTARPSAARGNLFAGLPEH